MRKGLKIYVLVTQLIMTLIILGVSGILIGRRIGDGSKASLFAGIGLIIGVFTNLIFIINFIKNEERENETGE